MAGCDSSSNCTSVLLPGGVESARKLSAVPNETLLAGGVFKNAATIQIHNSPGFLLKYQTLGQDFEFDREKECALYGQQLDDGLQICIREVNGSLAVGWQACPTALYSQKLCHTTPHAENWQLHAPMPKKILMSRYKQYTTTSYDRVTFNILHVEPGIAPTSNDTSSSSPSPSEPIFEPARSLDYTETWTKIFVPPNNTLSTTTTGNVTKESYDQTMIKSLTYSVTWLLRLYDDVFPDDAYSPILHLQNFMAIPVQFMVTCLVFANYSMPDGTRGVFELPVDMQTTAATGESTSRFMGVGWVVWLYIGMGGLSLAGVGGVLGWVFWVNMGGRKYAEGSSSEGEVRGKGRIPASTGFPELDIAGRLGDDERSGGVHVLDATNPGGSEVSLREFVEREDWQGKNASIWTVAKGLRKRRLRLGPAAASSTSDADPHRRSLDRIGEVDTKRSEVGPGLGDDREKRGCEVFVCEERSYTFLFD